MIDRSKREESVERPVESGAEPGELRGSVEPEVGGPFDPDELDPDELVVLAEEEEPEVSLPRLASTPVGRKAAKRTPGEKPRSFTPEQRLLILDAWQRSKLAATEFAPLVGLSPAALYKWRRLFEEHGPSGLEEKRGAPSGSKLTEVTRRAILLMKTAHPEWGQERLHHELLRTKGLAVTKLPARPGNQASRG